MKSASLATTILCTLASAAAAQTPVNAPDIGTWLPVNREKFDLSIRDPFAATDPKTWFLPGDYPDLVPVGTEVDHELIELTINTLGSPVTCKATSYGMFVVPTETTADSTSRLCPIVMKRGKFGYALDHDGKKITASLKLRLTITARDSNGRLALSLPSSMTPQTIATPAKLINGDSLNLGKPGPLGWPSVMGDVSATGVVTTCKIDRTSGSDLIDVAACRLIRTNARFAPAIGVGGKNIADRYSLDWGD